MKTMVKIGMLLGFAPVLAAAQSFPSTANPRLVLSTVPGTSFANMGLGFLSDGRMLVLGAATNTSPNNGAASTAGSPTSRIVGTCGSWADRAALVTASARTVPARMCASMVGTVVKPNWMWPASRSLITVAPPR